MSNTPDALPAPAPEGQPQEYTPATDPLMHRVTVIDEFIPGQRAERMGYQTNIVGGKQIDTSRDAAGNPNSHTTSVQEITLVDSMDGAKFHGVHFSQSETDIARKFKQVRRVKDFLSKARFKKGKRDLTV